ARAAVRAAADLGVAAVLCPARSGATARRVAAFRPSAPIAGISDQIEARGRCSLVWGVRPLAIDAGKTGPTQIDEALRAARAAGIVHPGELIAIVSAAPGKRAGSTDTVRV